MKFDSEKLLEEFGDRFQAGKWCKKSDCFRCEFMFVCPPRFILPKRSEDDLGCDYILRNLTYGWPLDKTEFHKEIERVRV